MTYRSGNVDIEMCVKGLQKFSKPKLILAPDYDNLVKFH